MGQRVCKECGLENEENAEYCMECGSKLHPANIHNDQENPLLDFLSKNSKTLIFIVAMVALLGVTIEFLGFMNEYNEASGPYLTNLNQSNEQTIQKAQWHQVSNYTGTGNTHYSFTIKGEKFRLVLNATPTRNYNTNFMKVDVKDARNILDSGKLNWGPRSAVKSKEKTINVTAPPGKYYINVHTKDLKKWKVTVYDYY